MTTRTGFVLARPKGLLSQGALSAHVLSITELTFVLCGSQILLRQCHRASICAGLRQGGRAAAQVCAEELGALHASTCGPCSVAAAQAASACHGENVSLCIVTAFHSDSSAQQLCVSQLDFTPSVLRERRYTAGANKEGVKIDRTTPALVRFKPTGSDYSAVEKDFIVAYYLPGPMQARLLMREQSSVWGVW